MRSDRLPRVMRWLLKTPVLVAVGLVVAYLLFGWFAFGPLAKWGAEKFVLDKTGHHLSVDKPDFDPLALSLTVRNLKLTEPDGKPLAGFKELFVDVEAMSLPRFAYVFDAIRLTGPEGNLALLPGGRLNWSPFIEAFKDEEEKPDEGLPRLLVRHFELKDGRLDFADRTLAPVFEMDFRPLELTLDELSTLPDDKGAYQISARTVLGAQLRWKGDLTLKPVAVTGAFSLTGIQLAQLTPYLKGRVLIAAPEGAAGLTTNYRVGYVDKKLSLGLDQLGATVDGLVLRGVDEAEPALRLDRLAVSGGRFDLDARRFDLAEIALNGGRINLTRRADGRLNVQDWFPTAAQARVSQPARTQSAAPAKPGAAPARPWDLTLGRFNLDGLGVHVVDQTFVTPLVVDVANIQMGFKADAKAGAGEPQARLLEGGVEVGRIDLSQVGSSKPLFALGGISVQGIQADLASKRVEVARLALNKGEVDAVRAANGRIPLLEALKTRPSMAPAAPAAKAAPDASGPGWQYRLARAELNDFRVAARDEGVKPAVRLTLEDIDAVAEGVSENLKEALPVKLSLKVKEGGAFQAQGKLVPARRTLDARLRLTGLNLAVAQPYVGQAANLVLASGRASSQGRFRLGDKIRYEGGFSVQDLLVNESETGNRFLAWKSLTSVGLVASPQAVHIGDLKLEGLGAKLVIYPDKTINLKRVLKAQPVAGGDTPTGGKPAMAGKPPKVAKPSDPNAFKLDIDRVGIGSGEMDFADQSLALPFGTRIHGLKGSVNGITSQTGAPAQLELDGLVDDYGLARAVGQIDFLDPTGLTDIKVVFRNVEMNRLTPYSATFAGRRIDSGKLSLDLEYKIKERQLQGENQIIMDKLTLGERVESPTARNLPLDLAIAILEDSDGRIDLGLPVSGSLDDPQFSYGGIIWKAIVNIITKIALAPFRAIGKLLGISGDKLEKVAFDAGDATLLPPERETLKQLAQALAKRPGLALTATPAWNADTDRAAIKDRRVRLALAKAMGRTLAADEDPGPVSTAQPATREGLEKLYAGRFGEAALTSLQRKFAQANPEPPPASATGRLISRLSGMFKAKEAPLSQEEAAALKGADLHALLYRQLLDKEVVGDEELIALARSRGEAIARELAAAGVDAARIGVAAPEKVGGEGREVAVKMSLGAARKPAAIPAAPQPNP